MQEQKNNLLKRMHKSTYFYPLVIVLGFCLAVLVALYILSAPSLYQMKEGDISLRTIYAPYDFAYPTTIDEEKTEKVRKDFEDKVLPVYNIDSSVEEKAFARLDRFFENIKEVQNNTSLNNKEKLEILKTKIDFTISDKNLARLVESKDLEAIEKVSKDALENIFLVGIIDSGEKANLISSNAESILIRNDQFKMEREIKTKELVDQKEAQKIVQDTLARLMPKDGFTRSTIYDVIKDDITRNVSFDEKETLAGKAKARDKVPPIYKKETVKKNELIIEKGARLTKYDIAKLNQVTRVQAVVNRTAYMCGLIILLLGLVLISSIYLTMFEKRLIRLPKHIFLIGINAFLAILVSLFIIQSQVSTYLIPLAGIAMILVLLFNVSTAFVVSLAVSLYIGIIAGGRLDLSFVLFVGSALGIWVVRGARRRSQIFFAGFAVSLINFFSIVGIGLLNNLGKEDMVREGLYGIANGIIASFIVIGLLPLFEYVFNLITNITLLELSDLSNPILKELTIKAPGTYHHSILVGNLAEEACDGIGANSLLARVGAYYHDIGKIGKAEYFVENEMSTSSKHDKLTPSMSALIITNHTKDGMELAKKHKLNNAIVNFISQHHGTSLIYYFYQRAIEKAKSETELKEEEFRYPGPRPQTKEVAIVLLADSVEASSRMLGDPTPARIRGLVQKIINNKFIDGQLDECDLTLKDLHKIAESFVRVLTGIFHTRLEYPEVKPKKERQNASKNKSKQSK